MLHKPYRLTLAQRMLVAMGLDSDLLIGHQHDLEAHPTKRGPGRKHAEGKDASRATARSHGGAGAGFVVRRASTEKMARRQLVKQAGRRQAIKFAKLAKREPTNAAVQGF